MAATQPAWAKALDTKDRAWKLDMLARAIVLLGGVSAILFIGAIFVFIGSQGFDLLVNRLSFGELLFGERWEPSPPTSRSELGAHGSVLVETSTTSAGT